MKKLFVFNGSGTLFESGKSGLRHLVRIFGSKEFEENHLEKYNSVKEKAPWGLSEMAAALEEVGCFEFEAESKNFVLGNLRKNAKELIFF